MKSMGWLFPTPCRTDMKHKISKIIEQTRFSFVRFSHVWIDMSSNRFLLRLQFTALRYSFDFRVIHPQSQSRKSEVETSLQCKGFSVVFPARWLFRPCNQSQAPPKKANAKKATASEQKLRELEKVRCAATLMFSNVFVVQGSHSGASQSSSTNLYKVYTRVTRLYITLRMLSVRGTMYFVLPRSEIAGLHTWQ